MENVSHAKRAPTNHWIISRMWGSRSSSLLRRCLSLCTHLCFRSHWSFVLVLFLVRVCVFYFLLFCLFTVGVIIVPRFSFVLTFHRTNSCFIKSVTICHKSASQSGSSNGKHRRNRVVIVAMVEVATQGRIIYKGRTKETFIFLRK